jgi:hypothetical protein
MSAFEDHWEMIHRDPVEGERTEAFKIDGQEVKVDFWWEIKRDHVVDDEDDDWPTSNRNHEKDWIFVSPQKVFIDGIRVEEYLDDNDRYDLIVEMARETVRHYL